jgi:hypothetical protein
MKGGAVETEETAVAKQRINKHVSAPTDTHTTTDELLEAVFYVRAVLRLYSEGHRQKSQLVGPSV